MMSQKVRNFITIINSILLLGLLVVFFLKFTKKENEIVYVDNIRLFNEFNMTKDLNQINSVKLNKQKKKLDSLYTIYNIFRDNNQTDKLDGLEVKLRKEDVELKNMNEQFSNELSESVWNRLNVYMKEFSAKNGYKMVLGTQGNGNVMFAQEQADVTDEVIDYSNTNYEGN